MQAEILHRQGYPAWDWEDRALLRAVEFLVGLPVGLGWYPEGDEEWQAPLINARYGVTLPVAKPCRHGKNMGFTDWTHG